MIPATLCGTLSTWLITTVFFKVNGLNRLPELPHTTDKFALEKSVTDCTTGFDEMIGLY